MGSLVAKSPTVSILITRAPVASSRFLLPFGAMQIIPMTKEFGREKLFFLLVCSESLSSFFTTIVNQIHVISSDGGGVRGYSSLLIVKRLMTRIRDIELHHLEGPVQSSVSYPWMGSDVRDAAGADEPPNVSDLVDDFLPCHYFDYMVGTSTGGYVTNS